jgi:hypothetical protein
MPRIVAQPSYSQAMAEANPIVAPAPDTAGDFAAFEGDWNVFRTGGLLPPMWGVWKEVRSGQGLTHFGRLFSLGFTLEHRDDHVALIYSPPREYVIDRLVLMNPDFIDGVGTMRGRDYCRFVMKRIHRRT